MLNERRREQRHAINRYAKFRTEPKAMLRDCLVTDISTSGARLFVERAEVPEQFELIILGQEKTHRHCRVMWRLGGEVGVAFAADGANDDGPTPGP